MGWWVLEAFRAGGPKLEKAWRGDGCKVLRAVAGQCFATTGEEWSESSSLLPGGGRGAETLQGSLGAPYGSYGAEPIQH